jgi:hypothetical protein
VAIDESASVVAAQWRAAEKHLDRLGYRVERPTWTTRPELLLRDRASGIPSCPSRSKAREQQGFPASMIRRC